MTSQTPAAKVPVVKTVVLVVAGRATSAPLEPELFWSTFWILKPPAAKQSPTVAAGAQPHAQVEDEREGPEQGAQDGMQLHPRIPLASGSGSSRIAARMAMIAITTSNSMSVNALLVR